MAQTEQPGADGASSIFLIGMMACGKSTIGRALADKLGWRFYDADRLIEERCGVPISYIFEKEGEAGFRARETQVLAELTAQKGVIVATGGGAPMFEINRRLLARGLVVQLAGTVSDIIERTRLDTSRPLLACDDKVTRIRELMLQRGPVYDACCNERVMTSRQNPAILAQTILELPSVRQTVVRGNAWLEQQRIQGDDHAS
ncbi:MAG: shikimate kinase [Duodenibacillus sp.]|nr:shikimate kinase [Duodenibacillus sp.]